MPAPTTRDTPLYLRSPPRDVRVTNWPLRDDPWRSAVAIIVGAGVCTAVGVVSHDAAPTVAVSLAAVVSLWRTWLPVRYDFDPRGVTQVALWRRRVISWLAVGDYRFTPRGLALFPRGEPTWWNAARGLFVLWSGKRDEIIEVVEYYLGSRLLLEETGRRSGSGEGDGAADSRENGR